MKTLFKKIKVLILLSALSWGGQNSAMAVDQVQDWSVAVKEGTDSMKRSVQSAGLLQRKSDDCFKNLPDHVLD